MQLPGSADGPSAAPAGPAAAPAAPVTERGRAMRVRLLAAARQVFERDGFLDARVTDISAAAGVAHGSFYTYFRSKTDVFRALVAATMDDLYASLGSGAETDRGARDRPADPVTAIERANRRFVAMYRENTALMALFEQVTTFDPEVRAVRQAARERMVGRVRHSIERYQADGVVAADLDAEYSAHALVAMVNGLVHYWLVLGGDFEQERLVETLTRLWAQSLGLPAHR
ncbi:DNA-binding transcriptional regulator, AcrR family [Blastococcus sp. DSM 46786]|uniref:TetR/AcrR family transcriptional regulator n=1 Tax=Blastococcus sp. DSM 46786 TaxID=1798227 RepID=UPI0008AB56B4|nr:TetR/AcrR family transcriptional regulator [Blastococcus sp. DSM 46786]SEL04564.1 DNA-binding transcriptional regulator, AcrR family [Blastococcus sp. DSM 46786]